MGYDAYAFGEVGEEDMIEELLVEGCWVERSGKRWWINPNPGSVKERVVVAVGYLREYRKNGNEVMQIWVPERGGGGGGGGGGVGPGPDESVWGGYPIPMNMNMNMMNRSVRVGLLRWEEGVPYGYEEGPGWMALPVLERGSGRCLGVLHIEYEYEGGVEGAVNEVVEVLTCVCKAQNLPLALTWAPCTQAKCGYGHSHSNYVSTVDRACFVGDAHLLPFHEACSDHHLLRGQGIVGTAFTTAKPCFATDITAFTNDEYPLAHHASVLGLHAAVAIPLRSVYTDFVVELFLPKDCLLREHQHHLLSSLSLLLQQACRSLHVVTEDELSFPPPHNPKLPFQQVVEEQSWIANMMEAQAQKGKGVCVSLEYLELEEPMEEFKVTTNCNWDNTTNSNSYVEEQQVFSDFIAQDSQTHTFSARRGRKSGEKRRTKAEKTISLPVLRQYFAGSLKDAAKSIGVCPTTLKRICRQHGITRWPSRKIKKVGHSLKKLQLVIDSVQGAEGSIQIGSFYSSFPELSSAAPCESKNKNINSLHGHAESPVAVALRVKATFADEKIRFSLQQVWGFAELQVEIARRFNLNEMRSVVLKYLDDEGEWVVLACDADLEECKDLHTASHNRTIRLALFQASPPNTFPYPSPST